MPSHWTPSATIDSLRKRAAILHTIREFFAARDVLEVETPLLGHTSVTDPFIQSIPAYPTASQKYYLQTSPEYAMKRLLAAGSGSIFQICKAFRQEEAGRFHNPEFTLLEWYRPGFNHHDLMNEMDELLQLILKTPTAERKSYAALFSEFLGINIHTATLDDLAHVAEKNNLVVASEVNDKDTWLQLLLSHYIEPLISKDRPCFIYDFPVTQAALARIQPGNPPTAARFEVYMNGIELANGFHELQDAAEQQKRFEKNLADRKQLGLPELPIDQYFLEALKHGLPDCAGVALGIDRLVMIATQHHTIDQVLSFEFSNS